jgi:AraC-like DNA-binding protein
VRTNGDWSEYWRSPDHPLEAMHAHFERHVYHRHSHEAYSFGVTEAGAQAFTCRGAARTSAEGMVMAFNPDEPHDGRAAEAAGFTYRIVHLAPDLVTDVLADTHDHPTGLPLFAEPVLYDPVLTDALRRLHAALRTASRLAKDEALADTVRAMVRRAAVHPPTPRGPRLPAGIRRVRDVLHECYQANPGSAELAEIAGCSRFALHRAFIAEFGMAPSDYQRQVRLRAARGLLADGRAPADVAAEVGFADQAHLTRWFGRCYGISPAAYRTATLTSSYRFGHEKC